MIGPATIAGREAGGAGTRGRRGSPGDSRSEAVAEGVRMRAYGRGREDGRSGLYGGAPPPGLSRLFGDVVGGRRAYVLGFRDGREERCGVARGPETEEG